MSEQDQSAPESRAHSHYFRDVSSLKHIDVYRVLELFGVTDPCLQHALKKILCAGQRGIKELAKDVGEARDTLARRLEMWAEDFPVAPQSPPLPKPPTSLYRHFEPHQLRVVDELEDLIQRMSKLDGFLSQVPVKVAGVERTMLVEQWEAMRKLREVLQRRVQFWQAQIQGRIKAGEL